jgi:hypothetical protein
MSPHPEADRPSSGVPPLTLDDLRGVLRLARPTPQAFLLERLRAADGKPWLRETLQSISREDLDLLRPGPWVSDYDSLKTMKREATESLKQATTHADVVRATLHYFFALLLSLAHDKTECVGDVTRHAPFEIEDSIVLLTETLGEEWRPIGEAALRHFC